MLERHSCDCGTKIEREYDPGWFSWQCPNCSTTYTIMRGPDPGDKTGLVFQQAIRRLEQRDAEGAAQSGAQFYELWIKSIVRERDRQWFLAHRKKKLAAFLRHVEHIYKLPANTLRGINTFPANQTKHDLKYTMKTADAVIYVDGIVATTWDTLMELIGKGVWERGEAGELNHLGMGASDKQFADVFTYHQHYRLGIVGPVMWVRTWWTAYRSGRTDWYKVPWTGPRRTSTAKATAAGG
jgi:hypothetical protein